MPVPAAEVFTAMFAIMGGLMVTALCILAGVRIVRWLKLPQDLPEGPLFEPPPPPLRKTPDRATAKTTAALQERLRSLYGSGLRAVRIAQELQERGMLVESIAQSVAGDAERHRFGAIAARVEAAGKRAAEAATKAEQAMRQTDVDRAERETKALVNEAESALAEAQAAMKDVAIPEPNRMVFLVLLVAFIATLIYLAMSWFGGRG